MATLILCTGFEHGVLSTNGGGIAGLITGSPTLDTTIKRSGTYSLCCGGSTVQGVYLKTGLGGTYIVGRFYWYANANPSDRYIMRVTTSSPDYTNYLLYAMGNNTFRANVASGTGQSGGSWTTGKWYLIEFKVYCGSTTGTMDWRIDGVDMTQATGTLSQAHVFDSFGFGDMWTALGAGNFHYFDDVAVSVTSGDYPLGPGKVIGLSPNAEGTHNDPDGDIQDNDSNHIHDIADVYAHLNSVPISESSLYIKQVVADTAEYFEVNFADISDASSVLGATAFLAYMSSGINANQGGCIVSRDGGFTSYDEIWGNPTTRADYSESSMFYKSKALSIPTGGWSQSAVNALKVRGGYSNDVADVPYWENLMIEVGYKTSVSLAGTSTGQSGTSGALTVTSGAVTLAGVSDGQSGTSGILRQTREFIGISAGQSGTSTPALGRSRKLNTTTVFVNSDSGGDGNVYKYDNADWPTVHDALTGQGHFDANDALEIRVTKAVTTGVFGIWRGFLPFFVTPAIPSGATIISARVRIYITSLNDSQNDAYSYLNLVGPTTQASMTDLVNDDYDQSSTVKWCDTDFDVTSITLNEWLNMPLNSTGLGAITKGSTFWFKAGLRIGNDVVDQPPPDMGEHCIVNCSSANATSNKPILEITYATQIQGQSSTSGALTVTAGAVNLAGISTGKSGCGWKSITPVLVTGFEHGVVSSAGGGLYFSVNGTPPTIQSSIKRSGGYALKVNPTSASSYLTTFERSSSQIAVGRFYVRFESWPASATDFYHSGISGNWNPCFGIDPADYKIGIYSEQGMGYLYQKASSTVSLGTWYRIDYRVNSSANPWIIDWQIDGVPQTPVSIPNGSDWNSRDIYGNKVSATIEFYLDDIVVSNTSGDYPIGPGEVVACVPYYEGTHNSGTVIKDHNGNVIDGVSYEAHPLLADLPMDSVADYVQQTGTGDYYAEIAFRLQNSGVRGVQAIVAYTSSGATANSAGTKVVGDSTDEVYVGDMSETTIQYKSKVLTAPTSGWTAAKVNALKTRVGFATNVDSVPRWQSLLLEVEYAYAPLELRRTRELAGVSTGQSGTVGILKKTRRLKAAVPDLVDENFEAQPGYDMTGWSEQVDPGCTVDADYTVNPYRGSQCLRCVKPSGASDQANIFRDLGADYPSTWGEFYFKWVSVDAGSDYEIFVAQASNNDEVHIIKAWRDGANNRIYWYLWNDGKFENHLASNPASLTAGQWYKVSFYHDATARIARWYIDDVLQNDITLTGTLRGGTAHLYLGVAILGSSYGAENHFDYFRLSSYGWPTAPSALSGASGALTVTAGGEVVTLAGSSAGQSGATATLSGNLVWYDNVELHITKRLPSLSEIQSGAVGNVRQTRKLAGISEALSGASSVLKKTRPIVGISAGLSSATGLLRQTRKLIGISVATSGATADLFVQKAGKYLQGFVTCLSSAIGLLRQTRKFTGASAGQSGAPVVLKVTKKIVGVSTGQSNVPVALFHKTRPLVGVSTGQSNVPLSHLHRTRKVVGISTGQSAIPVSHLHISKRFAGLAIGQSNVPSISLRKTRELAGVSTGQSAVPSSKLYRIRRIPGISTCLSSASGLLRQRRRFFAVSAGQSDTLANLFVTKAGKYLQGIISCLSSATGLLRQRREFIGLSSPACSTSVVLRATKEIRGISTAVSNVPTTALRRIKEIASVSTATSSVPSTHLHTSRKILGSSSAVSGASGVLRKSRELVGISSAQSTTSAVGKRDRGLEGLSVASFGVTGFVHTTKQLGGVASGVCSTVVNVRVAYVLHGLITCQSGLTASLQKLYKAIVKLFHRKPQVCVFDSPIRTLPFSVKPRILIFDHKGVR